MLAKLGGDASKLQSWAGEVMAEWQGKVDRGEVVPDGDDFAFWRNRWSERFGSTRKPEKLPTEAARAVPDAAATRAMLAGMRKGGR